MKMIKEINKDKAICEECGTVMNIPKSYAKLCYDCANEVDNNEQRRMGFEEQGI